MALGAHLWPAQAAAFVGLHGLTLLDRRAVRRARRRCLRAGGRRLLAALAAALLCGFGALRLAEPAPGAGRGPEAAPRAAQCRAGRGFLGRERRRDPRRLSQALRPRDLAGAQRRRRRHASVLAGIGVPVHPDARSRRAGAHRRLPARRRGAGHRRRARRGRRRPHALFQFHRGHRPQRAWRPSATTSTLWCRSANICRCGRCSTACASPSSSTCPAASTPASGSRVLRVAGLPDALAMICYEAIFPNETPGARRRDAPRRLDPQSDRRRLVRPHRRALPAFRAGAAARDRTGPADGARRQHRHFGDRRRARRTSSSSAPLGVEAVLDGALPGALPPTWQARWGAASFLALAALGCARLPLSRWRRSGLSGRDNYAGAALREYRDLSRFCALRRDFRR